MKRSGMWRVVMALVVCAAVSGTVSADDTDQEGSRPIHWQIAGPIVRGVQMDRDGLIESESVIFLKARGAPGPAEIVVVTGEAVPVAPTGICPDGADLELELGVGELIATCNDLSTMWALLDESPGAARALCIDFQGPTVAIIDYVVTGGTRRFEGASGGFRVVLDAYSVSPSMTAEDGTITGWYELQ